MKRDVGEIDATPSKRIYSSIIADYSLSTAICELVDNSIDQWSKRGRPGPLQVSVDVELDQQSIRIEDNAGGVPFDDLRVLVTPGGTTGTGLEEHIGVFGVGSKRAVVALGQQVKIFTRVQHKTTHLLEYDDEWLGQNDWGLAVYEVADIAPGSTVVDISKLRAKVETKDVDELREHLGATYAHFLTTGLVALRLNGLDVVGRQFDKWAFPPGYEPRRFAGTLNTDDGDRILVKAVAGLMNESGSIAGEYGVYVYCNDRLVARRLKTADVGFVAGLAGAPHNVVSLVRVLVHLNGPARCMPWNSNKSAINTGHKVFRAIQQFLMQSVVNYANVCKRYHGDWDEKVFQYKRGRYIDETISDFANVKRSFLPKLPAARQTVEGSLNQLNAGVVDKKPWARGPIEADVAVELLQKQKLAQKNRLSLIILDSSLEIAYKDFLVNDSGTFYTDAQLVTLFASRHKVELEVLKYVALKPSLMKQLKFYYGLRSKLIHERATAGVTEQDIEHFRRAVHRVLTKLFGLKWPARESL